MYTTAAAIVITILLGTPLAYALSRDMFPYNRVVNLLVELPIVLPPAVAGLALLITFGRRGVLGDVGVSLPFTVYAVVLAQAFVAMPFYVRTAVVGFRNVPRILEDAARVDGADERAVFQRIVLPMAGRTLVAGAVLGWARAMGEFGATLIFAGSLRGRTQTMPLYIYSVLERDVDAAVWAGVLLLGVAFVALSVSRWLSG
ncbi:MAG: ABC transporter permease [Chloroflexota bacterium]